MSAKQAVDSAAERLRNFMLVTASRPSAQRVDAIEHFAAGAGLSSAEVRELNACFERATKDEAAVRWAVIGVIVGVYLAEDRRG